jgi:ankyrin repeat protein
MSTTSSRRSSKTQILLREMNKEEKLTMLKYILNSDIKQIRKLPIETVNLNFLFPASLIGLKFDKEISPLLLCCYIGKFEIFHYLLSNDSINVNMASKPDLYSPLMISCYKGYYEIVRELLELHADTKQKNKNGQEAFIFCFSRLEQKSFKYENKKICFMLVELLLAYGADINCYFDNKKHYSIIMKLVSCEINDEEKCNTTCDVIKFLIEKGANINYRNADNQNVFNILNNNNKIAPKYKQEIYTLLNNCIQKKVFKDEDNIDDNNNKYLLTLYSSKHGRYNSSICYNSDNLNSQNHLKDLRNNLFKNDKDEMILQTIDDNSSSCCFIF